MAGQQMVVGATCLAALAGCSAAGEPSAEVDAAVSSCTELCDASGSAADGAVSGEAPDPSQPGPWTAGVCTATITDPARGRTFKVEIWYPVDPDAGAADNGEDNEYRADDPFGDLLQASTPARRNATPAEGVRPLVLFSHGYGGIRFQSYFLTEHLASHGFVVASPDHPGNTLLDFATLGNDGAAQQSAIDRPLDVAVVLDHMLDGSPCPSGSPLSIDPARIGITGHSFGGWTALESARRDSRLAVVFPMAPGFREGATPDFVAQLARPIAVFGGSVDDTTPFDSDQQLPYQLAQPPKHLIKLVGAGHLDFSNLCEVPIAPLIVDDGCDPESIDPADVHDRVRTLATAFARRYLLGQMAYDAFLQPDYAMGLGKLEYWREP